VISAKIRFMDNLNTHYLTSDQCHARAALIRHTAKEMKVEAVRLNLVMLAQRYDEMAARSDRSAEAAYRSAS